MSLTKLLRASTKLFKKEVITFLTIRRYDLGLINHSLRYIAVKPNVSISGLRQKVWHLLDLPDYCEELIILKSPEDVEIALSELRKGNDPHRPYILEVWLPGSRGDVTASTTVLPNNMLMDKEGTHTSTHLSATSFTEKQDDLDTCTCNNCGSRTTTIESNEMISLNKLRVPYNNLLYADFKKSDLSCRLSTSSIFKLHGRKSKDNFGYLLLKIQNDLTNLTKKLSVLENKISD